MDSGAKEGQCKGGEQKGVSEHIGVSLGSGAAKGDAHPAPGAPRAEGCRVQAWRERPLQSNL